MSALHHVTLGAAVVVLAAACSGSVASTLPGPSPVGGAPLGAWTVTITEDDFARAGLTEPGVSQENSGTFTFTVNADGTFTEAQVAEHPIRWPVFRGEWTSQGPDQLQLRTTFPADFAGEVIVIGWKLEAGGLQLRLISPDEPAIRVHFEAHPWLPAP